MTDLGIELLDWLEATLQLDPPWRVRDGRSLTWWPYRYRQQLVADSPRPSAGERITRLTAVTPLLTGIADADAAYARTGAANGMASLSAMVFDPATGLLAAHTAASFHGGNRGWLAPLFASAAALQIAVASESDPEAFAGGLGGTLDWAPHPSSGERPEPDDMLNVTSLYQRAGLEPTRMTGGDYAAAAGELARIGSLAETAGTHLTVHVAAPRLGGRSRIVVENSRHPGFGNGLFVLVDAPELPARCDLSRLANDLNRFEVAERIDGHAFGAWTPREDGLFHVAFYPNLLFAQDGARSRQARLLNLVLDEVSRARWLDRTWDTAGRVTS